MFYLYSSIAVVFWLSSRLPGSWKLWPLVIENHYIFRISSLCLALKLSQLGCKSMILNFLMKPWPLKLCLVSYVCQRHSVIDASCL